MGNSQKLIDAIKEMQLPDAPESPEQQNPFLAQGNIAEDMNLLTSLFKGGLAMSALYTPNTFGDGRTLDTHDQETCAQSETTITNYINDLVNVFKTFSETSYDDKQSMLDVTTIMVTTEMSRTMRQEFNVDKFEENGTDHNQLSNTVLIGGKGIKPSMVVGSSDLQSTQEWKSEVSGAHLEKDGEKLKTMGRPFDFSTFKERTDKPSSFVSSDYLTINSVVNTVYEVMGTPKEHWRKEGRSDNHYPTLGGFLTT